MWGFFSLALVAVGAAIFLLIRRYAAGSVPLVVKATTTYAWLVAFIVVVSLQMPSHCCDVGGRGAASRGQAGRSASVQAHGRQCTEARVARASPGRTAC
jgi:hypothetical protein